LRASPQPYPEVGKSGFWVFPPIEKKTDGTGRNGEEQKREGVKKNESRICIKSLVSKKKFGTVWSEGRKQTCKGGTKVLRSSPSTSKRRTKKNVGEVEKST